MMIDLIYFILSYLPNVHWNFILKATHFHSEHKTLNASLSVSKNVIFKVFYLRNPSLIPRTVDSIDRFTNTHSSSVIRIVLFGEICI